MHVTSTSHASLSLSELLELVQREALNHAFDLLQSVVSVKDKLLVIKTIASFKLARPPALLKRARPETKPFDLASYNAKLAAAVAQCETQTAAARASATQTPTPQRPDPSPDAVTPDALLPRARAPSSAPTPPDTPSA